MKEKAAMRFAVVLLLWIGLAGADEPREFIYGAELMSAQEREAYRRSFSTAKGSAERMRLREQHRERIRERARGRGVELAEPDGVVRKKGRP
jgi:hypothetical protein